MLHWLLHHQPPHFITHASTLWQLLLHLGRVWVRASKPLHGCSAMLSLATKVMPIGQAYLQLQVAAPAEAAASDTSDTSNRRSSNLDSSTRSSSQSIQASYETLQTAITRYQTLVMAAVLVHGSYDMQLPADVEALRIQLLFGPVPCVAAVQLTAACRYLQAEHLTRLQQQQRRGGRRRTPRNQASSSSSSSSSRQVSSRALTAAAPAAAAAEVCLARESACGLLLPPDHELMAAVLGENAVAAVCRDIHAGFLPRSDLMKEMLTCIYLLGKSVFESVLFSGAGAGASSSGNSRGGSSSSGGGGRSSSRGSNSSSTSTNSSSSSSGGSICTILQTAPGMQLLLELLALLIAESEEELPAVAWCAQLLARVVVGAPKAERRLFLSARGGLLVQVFGLVVHALRGEEQQGVQQQGGAEGGLEAVISYVLHCMLILVDGASGAEDVRGESRSLL